MALVYISGLLNTYSDHGCYEKTREPRGNTWTLEVAILATAPLQHCSKLLSRCVRRKTVQKQQNKSPARLNTKQLLHFFSRLLHPNVSFLLCWTGWTPEPPSCHVPSPLLYTPCHQTCYEPQYIFWVQSSESPIPSSDETAYRQEIKELVVLSKDNTLTSEFQKDPSIWHTGGVAIETDSDGLFMICQHLVISKEGTTPPPPLLLWTTEEGWHAHPSFSWWVVESFHW